MEKEQVDNAKIIYDGGNIRLKEIVRNRKRIEFAIEMDNPQQAAISKINITGDFASDERLKPFTTIGFFVAPPDPKNVDELIKLYHALDKGGVSMTDLETNLGFSPSDPTTEPDGMGAILNVVTLWPEAEGWESTLPQAEALEKSGQLGSNQEKAKAVREAIIEVQEAIQNGLFGKEPDVQRRMMKNVGRSLQAIYQQEHSEGRPR